MRPERLFDELNPYELTESIIPDFVLAFAFFTALCYAVLGKRFEKQRPAIAISVSMGFALSMGLVWWEKVNELSIKDLGPIAVGFAILVLAFVMYNSIKQVGGFWAGAGNHYRGNHFNGTAASAGHSDKFRDYPDYNLSLSPCAGQHHL